ncbi:MAG: FAD synthetase family protein [Sphaerochaetaceae bacterium]|nr:FAD synthetase family protein [Sphaerochaetaceae bacterium]
MEFYDFDQLYISGKFAHRKAVASIGVFDGLHLGHQHIIRQAVSEAKSRNGSDVVVFTFAQNPKMMLKRTQFNLPLLSLRLSSTLYESLGVDKVVVIDFSPDFSKLTGEEFIAKCCELFDVKALVVGENFRCGQKADTDVNAIKSFLHRYTDSAELIVPKMYRLTDGTEDSSTLIRTALMKGKMTEVSALLGRDYSLDLAHIPSRKNEWPLCVSIESFVQLLPPPGVYEAFLKMHSDRSFAVKCTLDDSRLSLAAADENGMEIAHLIRDGSYRYDSLEFVKELHTTC